MAVSLVLEGYIKAVDFQEEVSLTEDLDHYQLRIVSAWHAQVKRLAAAGGDGCRKHHAELAPGLERHLK